MFIFVYSTCFAPVLILSRGESAGNRHEGKGGCPTAAEGRKEGRSEDREGGRVKT